MKKALCLLLTLPLLAPAQAPEPTFRSTTSEVLLDLVVRDKHGQIIRNLRPDEVQVFEDGTPQKVRHFDFIDGHTEQPPAAPPASTSAAAISAPEPHTANELRDISVVSVVIGNLDPRGRKITIDAMRQFAKTQLDPNTYIGVFSLGMAGLRTMQPYTNDAAKVAAAVQHAAENALNGQLILPDQMGASSTGLGSSDAPTTSSISPTTRPGDGPTGPSGPTTQATASADGPAAQIANMLATRWVDESHDVYTDSMRFLSPLRTLVNAQAEIPGRKVVLLFSAGLPVHDDTVEMLHSVISAANRANVSVYALDTRGTMTQSTLDDARRRLQGAANSSRRQFMLAAGGDQTITADMVLVGETAETSIHSDTRQNMAQLAEGTGGALLPDTLDLREPLHEALEDVRTHYELAYSPSNTAVDGTFRKIQVKVSRPGARVFSRSGYYALPVVNGQQVYPFEMATLKALNTKPTLHQFDFRTAVLGFRPGPAERQMDFVFQAPVRQLQVDHDRESARIHVDVTALIRNEQGQVVNKISKDIDYRMPLSTMAQLENGVVSFTAPFMVPAGRYTLDTAVVDRQSMKASVATTPIQVSDNSGLAMSDVTVARRVDPLLQAATTSDPLQARGGKITPELANTVSPDASGKITFYATGYPPSPIDAPIDAHIEIWRDGKLMMRSPATAVTADPDGSVPLLAAVGTEKFSEGPYQVRVAFQYKGETVTKSAAFTLARGH